MTEKRQQSGMMGEALSFKVDTLESDIREARNEFRAGISGIRAEIATSIAALSADIKTMGKKESPWTAIFSGLGVLVAFCVALGGALYWPVLTAQAELKVETRATFKEIAEGFKEVRKDIVPRVEHDYRQGVTNERFDRMERRLEKLEDRK